MVEAPATRLWIGRLTWLALALLVILAQLLPLQTEPRAWAPPDMLLCLTLAWIARRPDFLPVWMVALVFFATDLLFQRPPGLWTALVVVLTEWLRRRSAGLRAAPVMLEWVTVATGIVLTTVAYRLLLGVAFTPRPPLALQAGQTLLTLLAYPFVAAIAAVAFGLRRPAPGEVDSLGHRI